MTGNGPKGQGGYGPLAAFTPNAEVVCADCMGGCLPGAEPRYTEEQVSHLSAADLSACVCDRCGQQAWVRSDVALLQRAKLAVLDAYGIDARLAQTGGMCAALTVRLGGGPTVVATECEGGQGAGQTLTIGAYWDDGWESGGQVRDDATVGDLMALVRAIWF